MLQTAPNFRVIRWICLAAFAALLLGVAGRAPNIAELLVRGGGDDLMRLQQVRDWLAGQSWFDTTQYRLLPPEGVSIHWSRYVDLGLAAILVPASWIFSQTAAEHLAVILWPTLLGCLAILVIGPANNRLFGPAAAIGALVTFLTWGKLGGQFAAGRIDHHNVQILCATAVFYLSVLPGRRWVLGALAGAMTALCLAVGLEMLPCLAVIWGMMVLRHAFAEPDMGKWLVGFCLVFAVAAPLLLAGQTAVAGWWINHCDVLAPPLLSLAAVGIAASLAPVVLARALPHPAGRILVALAVLAVGLWLAAPLLQPCLAGPYANASPEVRTFISTRIDEALSAATLLELRPRSLLRIMLPPVVIALLSLGATWLMRGRLARGQGIALIQAFAVVGVGFSLALMQNRAANLMTPALPLLAGFLLHAFATLPRDHRLRGAAALVLLLAIPAVVETATRMIRLSPAQVALDEGENGQSLKPKAAFCRDSTVMAEIASLPKSLVFASGNIGPAILVYTPHSITSAWYHRSSTVFHNGDIAFGSRKLLADALAASGAEHLVFCGGVTEAKLITQLDQDGWPDWLVEVTGDRKAIRIFRIDAAALAQEIVTETGTP